MAIDWDLHESCPKRGDAMDEIDKWDIEAYKYWEAYNHWMSYYCENWRYGISGWPDEHIEDCDRSDLT